MPRDLSELMEQAVSSAPPEKYLAGEITRAAERAQRRRTAWVAAGAAAAVAVVAGVTFGVTQHHPTQPEPAHGPYLYDQTVDVTQAVPASSLPGYQLVPWTVPSLQDLGAGVSAFHTYQEVDAHGRLLVEQVNANGAIVPSDFRLFDAPGQERQLQRPPSPGVNGSARVEWVPSFHDAGLIWSPSTAIFGAKAGFHLTDLGGGHDVFVATHTQVGHDSYEPTPMRGHAWVSGNRILFLSYDHVADRKTGAISYSLLSETFSGSVTKVADNVAAADVADGVVGWITLKGQVMVGPASGGSAHPVRVPLDPRCHVTPAVTMQNLSSAFAVSSRVIALTERCGTQKNDTDELLALDPTGRLLVHVTGISTYGVSTAGDHLLLTSIGPGAAPVRKLRYDLVTGSLATLGAPTNTTDLQDLQGAGDYVLWYDTKGGHVAKIPG